LKPRQRRLPPYTDYLVSRCASLYLLFPRTNLYSMTASRPSYADRVVSLLAAHYILVYAARAARSLVVEMHRVLSSTEVIESYSPAGYLDVAASTRSLLRLGPPLWRRVRRGPTLIDRLCLCELFTRILSAAEKLNTNIGEVYDYLRRVYGVDVENSRPLRRLQRRAERARKSLARIVLRDCGRLAAAGKSACQGTLTWRGRLGRYFNLLVDIVGSLEKAVEEGNVDLDIRTRGAEVGEATRKLSLRMAVERLYELYTLYIVLRALSRLGEVRSEDSTILVEFGKGIHVFYNSRPKVGDKPLSRVALGESDHLDHGDLERLSGIPDITLVINNRVKVVIEVKHSYNIGYLALARFKTIAYIHEYDADAGILVYPGLSHLRKRRQAHEVLDEEYEATRTVLEKAETRGHVTIRLRDNASLYIMPLIPEEKREQENIDRMYKVLNSIIREADAQK